MQQTRRGFFSTLGLAAGSAFVPKLALGQVRPSAIQVAANPLHPAYHLAPERGWMNDPCAPIFWKGQYHMFFQYNPHAAVWGDMHWGHAVSADMVHWRLLPVALAPTPDGMDEDGCFTGSAVIHEGVPTILYTGVRKVATEKATLRDGNSSLREVQMLATSTDASLSHWEKIAAPVIAAPPEGMRITGFRDPALFRIPKDPYWYTLIASGIEKTGGNVLLYRSNDLHTWEYLHPLTEGKWSGKAGANPVDTGEMWECPDFFRLDDRWVLIHSTEGKTIWQVGELDADRLIFHPVSEGVLNHGPYYAPKTQVGAHGQRILWGWIPEVSSEQELATRGWAGCMSLPRVLNVRNGKLCFTVADEVKTLRSVETESASMQKEVVISLVAAAREVPPQHQRIEMRTSPALEVLTGQDLGADAFRLDGETFSADGPIRMIKLFVDHSVLELFVGENHVFTKRSYGRSMEALFRLELPLGIQIRKVEQYALRSIFN